MTVSRKVRAGADVDTERLALDLESLAYEIENSIAPLYAIESSVEVAADDIEVVEITLTLRPTEDSIISSGYSIPYEDDV